MAAPFPPPGWNITAQEQNDVALGLIAPFANPGPLPPNFICLPVGVRTQPVRALPLLSAFVCSLALPRLLLDSLSRILFLIWPLLGSFFLHFLLFLRVCRFSLVCAVLACLSDCCFPFIPSVTLHFLPFFLWHFPVHT